MNKLKVGQNVYVKVDNFFEPFYKNRTVSVFYEFCSRTIKKLFKKEFYTNDDMTPPSKWLITGRKWDSSSQFVVCTKRELLDDLHNQKTTKEKYLRDADNKEITKLQLQLKKAEDAAKNRSNYYWKDFNDKVELLNLLEAELKG